MSEEIGRGSVPPEKPVEKVTLTPEESTDFKNLLVVGMLSDEFDLVGHKIQIRTLSTNEDLGVGMLIKPFIDSNSYPRAYKTAAVAAAIRTIDGEPLVGSLGFNSYTDDGLLKAKFNKVREYYPAVIDAIYNRLVELEKKLIPIVSRLGKTQS